MLFISDNRKQDDERVIWTEKIMSCLMKTEMFR